MGHCTPESMSFRVDTLSICPETFIIQNVPSSQYVLEPITATVYLKDSALLGHRLMYQYKTYALDFSKPYNHKSISLIEKPANRYQPVQNSLRTVADMQQDNQLVSTGSISRGVSVGNNQDLALNSTLNLQLSGKLSEDVTIQASISDKNIPIQPEGNTQYVQNINNIFITLFIKDYLKINAGDVEVVSPKSEFMSLSRNMLGLDVSTHLPMTKLKMQNSLGGGVAKGVFRRQTITPQNGVQGPYRLYGDGNEINIVIVAGSEKVYVDGQLLLRGQENDYTIDYNTCELTFTPQMLVTSEKRIIVEYEYSDRHYTRFNVYSFNTLEFGKDDRCTFDVNYFIERDMKNQSIQPELTDDQKRFLSTLPAEETIGYYAQCDSSVFSSDIILYNRKDTLVDGNYYSVYEYSTDQSKQLYRLSFTYMGAHKGSYVLLRSTANGRVFGWVAPENGEQQGDYAPVVQLVTPKSIQMLTLSGKFAFAPTSFVKTELALSHYDQNMFSKIDDKDNVGFAYFISAFHRQKLPSKIKEKQIWTLETGVDWQFIHKNFHAIESFRTVEFARDYNLNEDYTNQYSEQMLQAKVAVSNPRTSTSQYRLNYFSRLGNMMALRNELVSDNTIGRFLFKTNTSLLVSHDSIQKSRFWSSQNQIGYRFSSLELGVKDNLEHNQFRTPESDILRSNSYCFNEILAYLKSDSSAVHFNVHYKNREDYVPIENRLRRMLSAHEVNATLQLDRIKNQHFALRATYRNQKLMDTSSSNKAEHYFVGNVEYTGRFLKNAIVLNTYYEAGSGMELKRSFTFLKVAAGQGTHVWHDYNEDGIEDIGEFEIAAFQDEADYIKVWLAGTDYMNTYNNTFTQSIQLRPAAVLRNQHGFKKFLSRFSDVATFRSELKHLAPNFNPFYLNLADTNLIARKLTLNNTFSFNNSTSKFAFDFVVQKSQNKNLLYYGFEQSGVALQQIVVKSMTCKFLYLQADYQHSVTDNQSDYIATRTYKILAHQINGLLRLQFDNRYFGELNYRCSLQDNDLGKESVTTHEGGLSFTFRSVKYGTAVAAVRYVNISGDSGENGSVSYVMLKGLQVGQNAIWSLSYQVPVTDFLQLSLQYDGRVSEGHKVVHTGNVIIKAQF